MRHSRSITWTPRWSSCPFRSSFQPQLAGERVKPIVAICQMPNSMSGRPQLPPRDRDLWIADFPIISQDVISLQIGVAGVAVDVLNDRMPVVAPLAPVRMALARERAARLDRLDDIEAGSA